MRQQLAGADDTGELEARHADLTKRLAARQAEKDRYVKLYAQDHISEEELETYLLDLKNQIGNLRLLVEATEADLSHKQESALAAKTTEAWLLTHSGSARRRSRRTLRRRSRSGARSPSCS